MRAFIFSPLPSDLVAVSVPAPLELDLSAFRGKGLQPGEVEMKASAAGPSPPAPPVANEEMVAQLASMGFSTNGARRALIATNNNVEAAMEWVFQHMGDPDFNDPLPTTASSGGSVVEPSEENVSMIVSMGFSRAQAVKALEATVGV